jgi:hypothetical protein
MAAWTGAVDGDGVRRGGACDWRSGGNDSRGQPTRCSPVAPTRRSRRACGATGSDAGAAPAWRRSVAHLPPKPPIAWAWCSAKARVVVPESWERATARGRHSSQSPAAPPLTPDTPKRAARRRARSPRAGGAPDAGGSTTSAHGTATRLTTSPTSSSAFSATRRAARRRSTKGPTVTRWAPARARVHRDGAGHPPQCRSADGELHGARPECDPITSRTRQGRESPRRDFELVAFGGLNAVPGGLFDVTAEDAETIQRFHRR